MSLIMENAGIQLKKKNKMKEKDLAMQSLTWQKTQQCKLTSWRELKHWKQTKGRDIVVK